MPGMNAVDDPNRTAYGKGNGTSQQDAGFFRDQGNAAQGRAAPTIGYSQEDQDRSLASRGQQQDAIAMQRDAAMGKGPSAAMMVGAQQNQQAIAAQRAMAASARGPQAMAMAQQAAASNTAGTQQAIAGQVQAGRQQEMNQARDAYGNLTGQARQGDLASQQLRTQQQQYLGDEQLRNRAQNDAYSSQMYGNELGVNAQAQNAQNAAATAAEQYDLGRRESDRKDTDQDVGIVKMGVGALGSAASAFSDVRTKEGVTKPGDEPMDAFISSMGAADDSSTQQPMGAPAGGSAAPLSIDPRDPGNASAKFSGTDAPVTLFGAQGSNGPGDGGMMHAATGGFNARGQARYDGQAPGFFSDERTKDSAGAAPKGDVERMLNSFDGAQYNYKPEYADKPGGGRGEQFGPASAQRIEKTELGKGIVDTDENGVKRIDGQQAIKALMASVAYLNKKIEARK